MHSTGKEAAGRAAAELIESGMQIGIGTGSTARFFIEALGKRCSEGLKVHGVATSRASHKLALEVGIPILTIDEVDELDLTIDGADEIDPQKRMIKGGGGALLREKIIATHSREMVVIVDEGKRVEQLGAFGLPVEIVPFGYTQTLHLLKKCGYHPALRKELSGELYITDNRNYIADLAFPQGIGDPERIHTELSCMVGIVETGLFLNEASRVLVGMKDGRLERC